MSIDLQYGDTPAIAKPFGEGLPGKVWKLVEDHDKETYRVACTVAFSDVVYVLHAFQKKPKSGLATPNADRELVAARLKELAAYHREIRKHGGGA